jgi:hypothetical protein
MKKISLIRENNYMINFRALKIYVDDVFYDFIAPKELEKQIEIESEKELEIKIKVGWCSSNIIKILPKDNSKTITITSQIQNGLFLLIFCSFFLGGILRITDTISTHLAFGLQIPLIIIVYWQTLGKNSFLRLTKNKTLE